MATQRDRIRKAGEISSVFSPGAPVDKYALFAGRTHQVMEVIDAINQRGQHVILFGERGVGKTSLANVLSAILHPDEAEEGPLVVGIVNCDATDGFTSLWRKVLREIRFVAPGAPVLGFEREPQEVIRSFESAVPEDAKLSPDEVRQLLRQLAGNVVVIVDELDRVGERSITTRLLADTIKTLSDHSEAITLVLVGVAESVDDLIAEHRSIERSLVQVRMPRMSLDELLEIIDKGLDRLKMSIEDEPKLEIAQLSQGLPHYTHLLSLHAAQAAALSGDDHITAEHLEVSIQRSVDKAQQSILRAYHEATSSPRRDNLFSSVLLACALANTDDLGYFAAADVRKPMAVVTGKKYEIPAFSRHLNDFCEIARGPVLVKTGTPRRYRFRFVNPMMQPFVLMNGRSKNLISKQALKQLA